MSLAAHEELKLDAQRRAGAEALRQEAVHIAFVQDHGVSRAECRVRNGETNTRPASLNPTRFLNRSEVRRFLLEHAATSRPANKFSRVSKGTLRDLNERVRGLMFGLVHRAPSRGRTL